MATDGDVCDEDSGGNWDCLWIENGGFFWNGERDGTWYSHSSTVFRNGKEVCTYKFSPQNPLEKPDLQPVSYSAQSLDTILFS